jgi:hypothetical protein
VLLSALHAADFVVEGSEGAAVWGEDCRSKGHFACVELVNSG